MPEARPAATSKELMDSYERLFALRKEVQQHLEAARRDKVIGASLEAKVRLSATGNVRSFLEKHRAELPMLFIVIQVELADAPSPRAQALGGIFTGESAVQAEVLPADGAK